MKAQLHRIAKLTVGTFAVVMARRSAYASVLTGPAVLLLCVEALRGIAPPGAPAYALLGMVYVLLYVVLAVNTHRITLLGPTDEGRIPRIGERELRFAWMFLMMMLAVAAVMFVASLLASLTIVLPVIVLLGGDDIRDHMGLIQVVSWALVGLCAWVTARLSLVFPATAIDRPLSLLGSWRATQEHQGLMVFITMIFPLVLGAPGWLFGEPAHLGLRILLQLLSLVALTLVVTALSLTFFELDRAGALPTEPER